MKKVLLITNIPTPYRIPLFNEMNGLLESSGYKLKVIFAALGYARRKWEIDMSVCRFDYSVLHSRIVGSKSKESITFSYSGLNRIIKNEGPAVIIANAFSPATTKLWLMSYFRSIPYIIWSGAVVRPYQKTSWQRTLQRRLLISRAAGFITYGSAAKDYLVSLGAAPDKAYIGINTVDTTFYSEQSRQWRKPAAAGKTRFVYVGHLTRGKRLDLLFDAAGKVLESGHEFIIDIVGDGPERANLENLACRLGIDSIVSFKGFRQKNEIPRYLGRSNCFVFPSEYDVWGLVLVEAMVCGLPSIASVKSGATRDLVIDGKTGFAVDYSDVSLVADQMCWVIEHPEEVNSMGNAASEFINEHVNLRVSSQGFLKGIEACIGEGD